MGIFNFLRRKPEIRADTGQTDQVLTGEALLRSLIGNPTEMTREKALEIPTVQACINIMSATICSLPIRLYRKSTDGSVEIIENDPRVILLNDDTGDTLTAKMFWRAILEDYYLGKGGYAYINKNGRHYHSLHYVDERDLTIGMQSFDPIWKEYKILVGGQQYDARRFLKILRKTRDGAQGRSIIEENPLVLSVAYTELAFEYSLAKKGGMSRGYLQSEFPLDPEAFQALKDGFRRLYSGTDENVVVLNKGLKFESASATPTELQLNENKSSNSEEICKLFGIPASMICGSRTGNSMTDNDMKQFIRACVAVMTDIECSLNRDLLQEAEKGSYYWAFDTKELTRGSINERYEAYRIGLEKNFLQIDEVRAAEDMEPLGIDWIQMNLNTVLYNPETHEIYTPNTNQQVNLDKPEEGGETDESGTEI